jgi:hypothetical protein
MWKLKNLENRVRDLDQLRRLPPGQRPSWAEQRHADKAIELHIARRKAEESAGHPGAPIAPTENLVSRHLVIDYTVTDLHHISTACRHVNSSGIKLRKWKTRTVI